MDNKLIIALLFLLEGIAFLIIQELPVSSIITELSNFLLGYDFHTLLLIHIMIWMVGLTALVYFQIQKKLSFQGERNLVQSISKAKLESSLTDAQNETLPSMRSKKQLEFEEKSVPETEKRNINDHQEQERQEVEVQTAKIQTNEGEDTDQLAKTNRANESLAEEEKIRRIQERLNSLYK